MASATPGASPSRTRGTMGLATGLAAWLRSAAPPTAPMLPRRDAARSPSSNTMSSMSSSEISAAPDSADRKICVPALGGGLFGGPAAGPPFAVLDTLARRASCDSRRDSCASKLRGRGLPRPSAGPASTVDMRSDARLGSTAMLCRRGDEVGGVGRWACGPRVMRGGDAARSRACCAPGDGDSGLRMLWRLGDPIAASLLSPSADSISIPCMLIRRRLKRCPVSPPSSSPPASPPPDSPLPASSAPRERRPSLPAGVPDVGVSPSPKNRPPPDKDDPLGDASVADRRRAEGGLALRSPLEGTVGPLPGTGLGVGPNPVSSDTLLSVRLLADANDAARTAGDRPAEPAELGVPGVVAPSSARPARAGRCKLCECVRLMLVR